MTRGKLRRYPLPKGEDHWFDGKMSMTPRTREEGPTRRGALEGEGTHITFHNLHVSCMITSPRHPKASNSNSWARHTKVTIQSWANQLTTPPPNPGGAHLHSLLRRVTHHLGRIPKKHLGLFPRISQTRVSPNASTSLVNRQAMDPGNYEESFRPAPMPQNLAPVQANEFRTPGHGFRASGCPR